MWGKSGSRREAGGRKIALALLLVLSAPVFSMRAAAASETRIALVIGVSRYEHAHALSSPVKDAHAVGEELRRLNFAVDEIDDPDLRALGQGLRAFGVKAQTADTALVFYAGHGLQVNGENYLIPTDANLQRALDLGYEALPLSLVLDEVSQAHKLGMVLLDSCRDNPFAARMKAPSGTDIELGRGMARVNTPRNTLVVLAAQAGHVADDGVDHSPFAAAILATLKVPHVELSLFFRSVRDTVLRATQNRQEPFVFSSIGVEPFYFNDPGTVSPPQQERPVLPAAARPPEPSRPPVTPPSRPVISATSRPLEPSRPPIPQPSRPVVAARHIDVTRCASIVAHTQLGEPLSDADRAFLEKSCAR